jgi:hypothetical protein
MKYMLFPPRILSSIMTKCNIINNYVVQLALLFRTNSTLTETLWGDVGGAGYGKLGVAEPWNLTI